MQELERLLSEATTINQICDLFEKVTIEKLPLFTATKEQLENATIGLADATKDARNKYHERDLERDYTSPIIQSAVIDDRGQHDYTHVRGMSNVAIYKNPQRPNLPIVFSNNAIRQLASHSITPLKAVAMEQIDKIAKEMVFFGEKEKTKHKEQKHSEVLYWEKAKVNLSIDGEVYEIGMKLRCVKNGLKDNHSLQPHFLWDKETMMESLASVRGEISSNDKPESQLRATLDFQSSIDSINQESTSFKYLEVVEFTYIKKLDEKPQELGRTSFVVTAKGEEVETAFKLVDASKLIPSNTQDGRINPDFPQELQPRDRTRVSSQLQINKMANDLRPAQLTDSGLSSHGAPIVGADNVVESGNGRTMALIKAYDEGKAESYRKYLIENAARFNLKPEQVESMEMPVLVRERVTELDRARFARDSNLSDLQQMSAAETAWVDAEVINDNMIALFSPSETGNLLSKSNDAFIHSFLTEIGDNSTAGLLTEDGRPTRQLIERMQNAIFAKAYKNERLVKLVAEEPDPEIRNILNALNSAASSFVEMQYLNGEAHKQAANLVVDAIDSIPSIRSENKDSLADNALNALVSATELVRQAKETGQSIDELLAQAGLFGDNDPEAEALARFISANNRSAKRMARAFKAMADAINQELQHQGQALGDMFGGGGATLIDILGRVSQELESDGMQTGFMFESAKLDKLANQAATSPLNDLPMPTDAQKKAGNYKKGRVDFSGFRIAIENPKGSLRTGVDDDGQEWSIKLNHHYGDIIGTTGADGDPMDVFLGENEESKKVFVVNQTDQQGEFDEHKVMLGFDSKDEAKAAYLSNYEDNWTGFGSIVQFSIFDFEWWLRVADLTKAAKLS